MHYDAPMMHRQMEGVLGMGGGAAPPPVIETVRTFFPETWIWQLVDVG